MSEVSIEAFLVVERSVKCCTSPNYVIPVRVFPGGQFTTISLIVLLHPCVLQAMQSYIGLQCRCGQDRCIEANEIFLPYTRVSSRENDTSSCVCRVFRVSR